MSLLLPKTQQKTIGIIGAAIAGPVFALQILSNQILSSRYIPVLYDKSPEPIHNSGNLERDASLTGGAGVAIFANGLYPLYQLGLKQILREKGKETPKVRLWRGNQSGSKNAFLGGSDTLGSAPDLESALLAIERRDLQGLLIERVKQLGGRVEWSKQLQSLEKLPSDVGQANKVKARFIDGHEAIHDLIVGADGAYSEVRRFILRESLRSDEEVEAAWMPHFYGMTAIYGIASLSQDIMPGRSNEDRDDVAAATHGIMLDLGNLSSSPLPGGRIRWDLVLPEKRDIALSPRECEQNNKHSIDPKPGPAPGPEARSSPASSTSSKPAWHDKIQPGLYPVEDTISILNKHLRVYHPQASDLENILNHTIRMTHGPLRQRVWSEPQIQSSALPAVLVGDAAHLFLPSSGQGTSFAIEDATVLASLLLNHDPSIQQGSAAGSDIDLEVIFDLYAKERVPRAKRMAQIANLSGTLGLGENWFYRTLRDWSAWLLRFSRQTSDQSWPFDYRVNVELKAK